MRRSTARSRRGATGQRERISRAAEAAWYAARRFHGAGGSMVQRSVTARGAFILGCTAVGGLLVGVGGIQIGALRPFQGFKLAAGLGLLFGLLAVIASLIALWRTSPRHGRTGRSHAWMGLGLGSLALFLLLRPAFGASGFPPIHDVT